MRSPRHEIAFYAPWAGPTITPAGRPTGGAEVQVLHLARTLARRGHRVKIVTYATPGLPDRVDGITVVGQWRASGRRRLPRQLATLASSLYRLLRIGAPVVVQRSAGSTTGLVALVARLSRRRFVYSSASTIEFTLDRDAYPFAARGLFALGVRLADEVVVQTNEQAQLCLDRFGRRPVIIRSVAEPAAPLPPDARAGEGGLLWIGRLVASKNPSAFLDLAAALPDVPCTLVYVPAPDDPPDALEVIANRARQLPNVELLGPQPRVAMLDRIARATAIVSTSDHEGMPNTLLEGWSRGVPALTLVHDPDGIIERERIGHCAGGDPDSYGTQALRPISNRWIALGVINTFDPIIFGLHLVALMFWAFGTDPVWTMSILYIVVFFYYVLRFIVQGAVKHAVRNTIPGTTHIIVAPTMRFFQWRIAADTDTHHYVGRAYGRSINIYDKFQKMELPKSNELFQTALKDKNLSAFVSFSPLYRWEINEYGEIYEVRLIDLRYRSNDYYPFVAVAHLNHKLEVVNSYTGWIFSEDKLRKKLDFSHN